MFSLLPIPNLFLGVQFAVQILDILLLPSLCHLSVISNQVIIPVFTNRHSQLETGVHPATCCIEFSCLVSFSCFLRIFKHLKVVVVVVVFFFFFFSSSLSLSNVVFSSLCLVWYFSVFILVLLFSVLIWALFFSPLYLAFLIVPNIPLLPFFISNHLTSNVVTTILIFSYLVLLDSSFSLFCCSYFSVIPFFISSLWVKVKFTVEQATKAHRGSIGIALLFL